MLTLRRPELDQRVDEFVEAFEQAMLCDERAQVRDFLPPGDSEEDRHIARELLCVDLHYRWQRGENKPVRQYMQEFSHCFSTPQDMSDLAHEEFRLRVADGQPVSHETYRQEFQIDTSRWPGIGTDAPDTATGQAFDETGIDALGTELKRLVDSVVPFPVAGERFGDFQLVEQLGQGTFAVVFLARQFSLEERPVVLKITTTSPLEAALLSKLQHTNIVPIYSLHRADTIQAICMPYFGRTTLADELAANSRSGSTVAPNRSVDLTLQVASGLQHAHERGIVHRDLKPANILLADDGTAMVLDFNLSDEILANGNSTWLVGGTLPYLSPQHLAAMRSGRRVDAQADIYSLGVILYQMLSGRLPFPTRTSSFDTAVRAMIEDRGKVPCIRTDRPTISCGLEAIVQRMLAPESADRYQSMDEVIEDLTRHRSDQPLKFAPERSLNERARKWARRHPRLVSATSVLCGAAVVLAFLVAALMLRGNQMARQDAVAQLERVRRQVPEMRALTSSISADDRQTLAAGLALSEHVLHDYGVLNSAKWKSRPRYAYLNDSDQADLDWALVQSLYSAAAAHLRLAQSEKDATERTGHLSQASKANQAAMALDEQRHALPALAVQSDQIAQATAGGPPPDSRTTWNIQDVPTEQATDFLGACALLEDCQYEPAVQLLEVIRSEQPYDVSVWFMLGQAYGALGRLEDAEACFSVCISLWPESYLGYHHRGRCRLDAEKYAAAATDFTACLARKEDYIPALINRAVAHRELADYESALADLSRAIELGAPQTRVYLLRSEILARLGETRRAAADRQMGLTLPPIDEQSCIARGLARLRTSPEKALEDFELATQWNPRSYAAWRNIAHVYAERLNRPNDAIGVLDKLLTWTQRSTNDLVSRGVIYARTGKRDQAHDDARRVLQLSPNSKELFQLGCIYSLTSSPENNDADISLALIEKSILIEPKWLSIAMKDPDLQKLRASERFKEAIVQMHDRTTQEDLLRKESGTRAEQP